MQELFEIECTLEELLAYEKMTGSISSRHFQINTKFGKKHIEGIDYTAYNEPTYSITTETGKNIKASKNHILFQKNKEITVNDILDDICNDQICTIETIDGEDKIEHVSYIGDHDLIDIQVEDVNEFYLANGIRSHNSTLSDVIKFGIYGRLENKKLKDMANRLNKNAYVKIELLTAKGKVIIERGIEPSIFNLWINPSSPDDKPFDKAGKKSVQEYLEEEILEMPFYVFANTLSLSINDFKSFIKMSNSDKKAIIDKIFGLQVLNQMRELLKQQMKKIKEVIENLSASVDAFIKSVESTQTEIESLEERIKKDNKDKKAELLSQKIGYEKYIQKCVSNMTKIENKIKEVTENKKVISSSILTDRQLIVTSQEKIDLYKNSKCPTCESDLNTDFHHEILRQYETSLLEATERLQTKNENLKIINKNQQKLDKLKSDTRVNMSNAQVKLKYVQTELDNTKDVIDDLQMSSLRKILKDSEKSIQINKDEQTKNQKGLAFYGLVEEILGDKGVKQLAIRTILPPLNSEISKIIKTLGIDHKIVFNEEFDAKITHFGQECSPDTLSTGEMKKVDFAVLLAVIKMMKMKFPFMNLLFLDEIFSSIDGDGQYHILKILRECVKDMNLNIFVISHYPLSYAEFDYRVDINKINGFSTFEITHID